MKTIEEINKIIEEALRDRILFIGNEIPKYFTKDKRDKQLYLGYPQQIIDEVNGKITQQILSLIEEHLDK